MCEVLDPHRAGVRVTATEGEILIDTAKARAGLPLGPQHPTLLGSPQVPAAERCLVKEGTTPPAPGPWRNHFAFLTGAVCVMAPVSFSGRSIGVPAHVPTWALSLRRRV